MSDTLPDDDLGKALADAFAALRREIRQALDVALLEFRTLTAELRAENAALHAQLRECADVQAARVDERMAQVKDGMPGRAGIDGIDGTPGRDGVDGKDAEPIDIAAVERLIEQKIAAIPTPRDGRDGIDGKSVEIDSVVALVDDAVAALPPPQDGRDGRDGAGIEDAFIGRDGELVLVWANGRTKNLGAGFAKDLNAAAVAGMVRDAVRDVWGGKWEPRSYEKGVLVGYGGSVYVAAADLTAADRPTASDAWELFLRRGRDGKDAEPAKPSRPAVMLPEPSP